MAKVCCDRQLFVLSTNCHTLVFASNKISLVMLFCAHWRRQGGSGGPAPPMAGQDFFVKIEGLLEPVVLNVSF